MRLNLLPKWVYPSSTPSIYDTESVTALEGVAKLHGKMNELIGDYNAFAESWNKQILDFEYSTTEELKVFEASMRQEFQDFIDTINVKYDLQEYELNKKLQEMTSVFDEGLNEFETEKNNLMRDMEEFGNITQELGDSTGLVISQKKTTELFNTIGTFRKSTNIYDWKNSKVVLSYPNGNKWASAGETGSYATLDFVEMPASRKIISNFRIRGISYYSKHETNDYTYNPVAGEVIAPGVISTLINSSSEVAPGTIYTIPDTISSVYQYFRIIVYKTDLEAMETNGYYLADGENYVPTLDDEYGAEYNKLNNEMLKDLPISLFINDKGYLNSKDGEKSLNKIVNFEESTNLYDWENSRVVNSYPNGNKWASNGASSAYATLDYVAIPASRKIISNFRIRGLTYFSNTNTNDYTYNAVDEEIISPATISTKMEETPAGTIYTIPDTISSVYQYFRIIVFKTDLEAMETNGYYLADGENYVPTLDDEYGAEYVRLKSETLKNKPISLFDNDKKFVTEEQIKPLSGNVLYGKKYVACGDSFTAGDFNGYVDSNGKTKTESDAYDSEKGMYKTYPWWIAKRNNMSLINEAINGTTMANINNNSFCVNRYKSIPLDADYITLWFGINDESKVGTENLGTLDSTDITTFYGAWNVVLDYLTLNHPWAKIGIIITNGTLTEEFPDAIRSVAKKWGIPYLDLQQDYTIPLMLRISGRSETSTLIKNRRKNQMAVSTDTETYNIHPNLKAHEYQSTFIEAWLRTL